MSTRHSAAARRWPTRKRGAPAAVAAIAAMIAAVLVAPTGVQAGTVTPMPRGDILAGSANSGNGALNNSLLPKIKIGKIATQYMPCVPDSGQTYSNRVAGALVRVPGGVKLLTILDAGVGTNSGTAVFDDTSASVTETSSLARLRLLTSPLNVPLVSLDAITATAQMSENTAGAFTYTGSSSLLNLKIAGVTVLNASPAPNTVISLGPIGKVILNEQIVHPVIHSFIVNAIHIHIANLLGYSGDIYLGQTRTYIASSTSRLQASAFELSAQAAVSSTHVSIGRQNLLSMKCTGTNGVEADQSGVGLQVPGLATVNALQSVVNGNQTPVGGAFATATAQVANLSILGGRITLDAITSRSTTTEHPVDANGDTVHSDASGTSLVNLKVDLNGDGVPDIVLGGDVAPNTTFALAGIGKLILNRQLCEADSGTQRLQPTCDAMHQSRFTVTGIFIKIAVNIGGLTVGSVIRIAEAESGVSG